jgi:hypothetical protein
MVAINVHGPWHTFRQAGGRTRTRRSAHDSRRFFRSGSLELLEPRMLLSLGDGLASNTSQDQTALIPEWDSAQVSNSPPASSTSTAVSVSVYSSSSSDHADVIAATMPRQISPNGDLGFAVVTRPTIFLRDQDGNYFSSLDDSSPPDLKQISIGLPDSNQSPTNPSRSEIDEQAQELTPDGLAKLPKVPWMVDYSVKGTLTSDRNWMTFSVPVGPSTNTLRLAVHPENEMVESTAAMVDQLYLVRSDGTLIAQVNGVASVAQGSRQTLIVSLQSAPAGSWLVVRVIQPYAEMMTNPAGSTGSSDSGDGLDALTPSPFVASNNFMLDVHRDDISTQSPGGAPPPSTPDVLPPGSYLPSTPGATSPQVVSVPASQPGGGAISYDQGYASNTAVLNHNGAYASIESHDVDSESTPVSLGPLVSRGAAPMGPALATSIDDPAPSINRDDQGGGDPNLERLESEDGQLALKFRLRDDAERTTERRLDPQDAAEEFAPFTALKGLGGLPLLVASIRRNRATLQAEDLVATLQNQAEPAPGPVPADEDLTISSTDPRTNGEGIAKAGIATRAVGFIIALGLASGPLYPDLIALARRKLACKRRAGSSAASTSRNRRFRRRSPWSIV